MAAPSGHHDNSYHRPPDVARTLNALAQRISALERTTGVIVGDGPPSSVPQGTVYIDQLDDRLWVNTTAGLRSVVLT